MNRTLALPGSLGPFASRLRASLEAISRCVTEVVSLDPETRRVTLNACVIGTAKGILREYGPAAQPPALTPMQVACLEFREAIADQAIDNDDELLTEHEAELVMSIARQVAEDAMSSL
jgi:hypothetical protein